MQYSDYPHTFAALRRHLPSIATIRPSHRGVLAVINSVRNEVGLQPLDINELVMATLGRIEDKLDGTQGTEARPENSNEQEESQTKENT